MTQRLVPGAGRSAMVSGLPSGPITYLTLGRWGSFIEALTTTTLMTTLQLNGAYRLRLKKGLNAANNWVKIARDGIAAQWRRYCLLSGCLTTLRTRGNERNLTQFRSTRLILSS